MIQSYRHYLESLENKTRFLTLSKFLILLMASILIIISAVSSLIYFENQRETPIKKEAKYLQKLNGMLISAGQSFDEITTSFQVAGAKVQLVDNLKESSESSSGFFISLDDLEKSLSKIELVEKNLENQKQVLRETIPPSKFADLNSHVVSYLETSYKTLDEIYIEQSFVKDILYASGPNFYLPILTDETIWKEGNHDAILTYYKDTKSRADVTLKSLSKLNVPEIFKPYYDTQVSYLTLLVTTSDNIINIVSQKDDPAKDTATQLEKAYQILNSAKVENVKLSENLLAEKTKVFDVSQSQNRFALVKLEQNSLEKNIQEEYQTLPPTKIDKILETILGGLQHPASI